MELLSPAGNTTHIDAAIKMKSDAVYGGLKNWNARNKAINFSLEDYNESVRRLHKNNIKFYLTLNTLVLDNEIIEILEFLKNENTELPDAFIVADIGLIQKLKEDFPNIPLHFSTQFGVHNLDDLKLLEVLGGSRAILARELTLSEINNLKANTKLELECFVWGSQCISFSGLCFFGTIINGGSGNRGKCIITCRDVYTANDKNGNLLYVPDLDCINSLQDLNGIDCIKLEGRRRKSSELEEVINQIKSNGKSNVENGYIYGSTINENNLFEIINSRIKPQYKVSELETINNNDVFIKYKENVPMKFSKSNNDNDVFYVYSELKKSYDFNKKNLYFELKIEGNIVSEVLYVNYKGEGKTFYNNFKINNISFDANNFLQDVNSLNENINVYKIRYIRNKEDKYYISVDTYKNILKYIRKDCKNIKFKKACNNFKITNKLYVETEKDEVIEELINNDFVKVIYNISSFDKLKSIKQIIDKYDDKIIYKLPLFNWKSEDVIPYYSLLEEKDVMFTRLSQIHVSKNIKMKKKYIDYTVYTWNKYALDYLKRYGITNFTASPELSYFQNLSIFQGNEVQFIIGGKLPLIYSRQCFSHLYDCDSCIDKRKKELTNNDKDMDYEIICFNDNRILISKNPILNDYTKVPLYNNATFRYVTYGQTIDEIKESIRMLEKENYYLAMKNSEIWKNSYENNIIEERV